jgi:biopolymer transport protein ExbD
VGEAPDQPLAREEVQRPASGKGDSTRKRRVLVAGDASINYGQIMQAMVTLQLSGAPEIGLMSDPER